MSVASLAGAGPLKPARFRVKLDGCAEADWRVRRLELREGLSEPYRCTLDLEGAHAGSSATALQGSSCVVLVERGTRVRRLCGIVTRVEWRGKVGDAVSVRLRVEPALAALAQTRDCRIFQEASVKDVLGAVLSPLSGYGREVKLQLDRSYEPREYTTQYDESDLDFALRLMSEEGIFFFFDHSGEHEQLILVDGNKKCPPHESERGEPVPIVTSRSAPQLLPMESIERLHVEQRMGSTGVVLRDFDWTQPRLDLTQPQEKPKGTQRTVYEYPSPCVIAGYDEGQKRYTREEAQLRVKLRNEELGARRWACLGDSNLTGLAAGQILEVGGEVEPHHARKYLILGVEHEGQAAEMLEDPRNPATGREYRNRFTCIPLDVPYRPPLADRVVVHGPQTATVVGPPGQEIHTDAHGRIKVQFHWDRQGNGDDRSSCFVRVAQAWAGGGWGFVFLPRVGMEVVVQFLEGNPDRPLVTGCVYNGDNVPPYELPAQKTVSAIKSSSSPGGSGSNELRFEDAAGSEELFVHAQKDMNSVVENDRTATVKANDTTTVEGTQTNTVKDTRTTTVTGKETQTFEDSREVTVKANDTLTVETGTRTVDVKGKLTETYQGGRGATVQQGDALTVEGSNKTDTVHGEYSITADTHFKVSQNADQLLICDAITLKSAGDITIKNGACAITASAGGKLTVEAAAELRLTCGASSLTLKSDGTIEVNGTSKVNLSSGASTLALQPASASLNSAAITSTAMGIHDIQGAIVKVNG